MLGLSSRIAQRKRLMLVEEGREGGRVGETRGTWVTAGCGESNGRVSASVQLLALYLPTH